MITAGKLAGFLAAHAVWCVYDGEVMIPMLGFTDENDGRHMERLVADDFRDAVALGKQKLDANEKDANDAVLAYDARLPLGDTKIDAIIVEMRAYFSPDSRVTVAIPYTPLSSGRFAVHKPKILAWENCDDFALADVVQAFFAGVAAHEHGAKIWNDALDESK